MFSAGFEPAIPASYRPHSLVLATGICTARFNIRKFHLMRTQYVDICCVWVLALYINWSDFIIETESVYFAV